MLQAGKTYELIIVKFVAFGVYLAEDRSKDAERVLLPKKQVPPEAKTGDTLQVFLYRDSSDRLIATTRTPMLQLGEVAALTVASVSRIGAFLDWGLEKDLFLPFKEQTGKVAAGDEVLAALYLDKSERLCATMRVYPYLKTNPPYAVGDMVSARVYDSNPRFGLFIALEDCYSGLIPARETQGHYRIGDTLLVRVLNIREDGRTDASPKQKAYLQLEPDADMIYKKIEEEGGVLLFDDHASPELISSKFGLSKAAFKRAVGHLLKEKRIQLKDGQIHICG